MYHLVMSCDSRTEPIPHSALRSTWEMTVRKISCLSPTTVCVGERKCCMTRQDGCVNKKIAHCFRRHVYIFFKF